MPDSPSSVHHYVPQWYQDLFIPAARKERRYYYLDLRPERIRHAGGGTYLPRALNLWGTKRCFQESGLYTIQLRDGRASDALEKHFFGKIDDSGARAFAFFRDYEFDKGAEKAVHDLLDYLGAQKLRTPKGLAYLKASLHQERHEDVLDAMRRLEQLHHTIWMECVWEVITCERSLTKFIVSDHPVTTYNPALFPRSRACPYPNDPPIGMLGTRTFIPLAPTRCLALTNLGLVRDPGATPTRARENARSFENTVFSLLSIQTGREIPEDDVLRLNYIIKMSAGRYIAAAEEEWLYPERRLRVTTWTELCHPFLLMPDPRKVRFTTSIAIGFSSGEKWGMDEYGRRPQRDDPDTKALRDREWSAHQAHQALWDRQFGPLSSEELRGSW